jgi:rRNA small subunit pseudouridine methyltransferase Nep1
MGMFFLYFAFLTVLIVQLLHKLSIKATEGGEKLMTVIKNPITDHIPAKCHKIGTSHSSQKLVDINDYVAANFKKEPVLFVIGAFAHGTTS